jgi:hypothetical protein
MLPPCHHERKWYYVHAQHKGQLHSSVRLAHSSVYLICDILAYVRKKVVRKQEGAKGLPVQLNTCAEVHREWRESRVQENLSPSLGLHTTWYEHCRFV